MSTRDQLQKRWRRIAGIVLAAWMISNGISVVQVNPYAVKRSKEIEDNSQLKDDRKDPKLIANLVKDGNYGMPYLPEKVYADMRRLSMFRDQLTEDRIRNINRLHRELKIYFPEYMDAFGKIDGAFTLEVLKVSAIPSDIAALGAEGIKNIWHDAKLRGRGYSRAGEIVSYANKSEGLKDMLRHYFAQSRLDAGWKLPMIANALGHKDTRTTELYLRIPENERLVASKEYFEMYGSLIDEEETSL